MKMMKYLQFTKGIFYLSILCLFLVIPFLKIQPKDASSSSSSSTTTWFPSVNLLTSSSTNSAFRNELINERLKSHSQMYDNSPRECNITVPLNKERLDALSDISKLLISLRQQIVPYPNEYFHGRGIVLTIGQSQLGLAKVNLKMLELSGTRLPVQIWYSSSQIPDETMIKLLNKAPKLNTSICCFDAKQCRTRTQIWQLNPSYVYKPHLTNIVKAFPYKPAAIISATFVEVLFLDSDAYVTRDPEELFLSDPMYLKFGALFHADAHKSRQHPSLWKFFNTSCAAEEYEIDSATILVNKKRVWNGLYMTKLMNDHHGPIYDHASEGDKDTFRLGFRYMDVKYYIVSVPCSSGVFDGTRFCGRTICKTDSLAQHIYVNHIHIFKYEGTRYVRSNLDYTRIGLVDSYNNPFLFDHCRLKGAPTSCFQLMNKPNPRFFQGTCYVGEIPAEEIEDRKYMPNQPLLFEKSRDNRAFISKTDNLIPHFIDNVLKYLGSVHAFK